MTVMDVGNRLRTLRDKKNFSQGDIQKRTGLLRPYISRVENGHTVPSLETLEKFAYALEIPLYQLFYDGEELPRPPHVPGGKLANETARSKSGQDRRFFLQFGRLLGRIKKSDRELLLFVAQKMAFRK